MSPSPWIPVLLQLIIASGLVVTAFWIRRLRGYQEQILRNEQQHRQDHEHLNEEIRSHQVDHEAAARQARPMVLRPPAVGGRDVP